ncbi:uncharacterized protein BDZ99DRAFT_30544 [Mytilinidion resinicola]|uniref:Uncharacterized protein n=1 Tax=Mytilinidion resinicola TaxID=574789 RepID=A0A6A6YKZ0_9PEZI|nr:uncharacterized protein BDZ99DRAFT_30544 [Mytilinidion resinicola]KAF2809542.1 hypothetical protein BDZ99DRAFT_30544 [Mytilinidion resinicola]
MQPRALETWLRHQGSTPRRLSHSNRLRRFAIVTSNSIICCVCCCFHGGQPSRGAVLFRHGVPLRLHVLKPSILCYNISPQRPYILCPHSTSISILRA